MTQSLKGLTHEIRGNDGCLTTWIYLMPLNKTFEIVKMINFMLCICYQNKKEKIKENPSRLEYILFFFFFTFYFILGYS